MTQLPDLPTYRSHKLVHAARIVGVPVASGGQLFVSVPGKDEPLSIEVPDGFYARSHPKVGDYLVVYRDGYMSHCPAKEFEDGYRLVPEGGRVLEGYVVAVDNPHRPLGGWTSEALREALESDFRRLKAGASAVEG